MAKGVWEFFLRGTMFALLMILPCGCDKKSTQEEIFRQDAAAFRNWRTCGWGKGLSWKDERLLLSSLGERIRAETDDLQRARLYACYTNELLNVPFFVSNGIVRTSMMEESMSKRGRGGVEMPVYVAAVQSYKDFLERVRENAGIKYGFDYFCLKLEMWKRLRLEHDRCGAVLTQWVLLRYEDYPRMWLQADIKTAQEYIGRSMSSIERELEGCYDDESEESRHAYELFREVIGREAVPRYKR